MKAEIHPNYGDIKVTCGWGHSDGQRARSAQNDDLSRHTEVRGEWCQRLGRETSWTEEAAYADAVCDKACTEAS